MRSGVLEIHGGADGKIPAGAGTAQAQVSRGHAKALGVAAAQNHAASASSCGTGKCDAVAGQPVVDGEHQAAGPVSQFPGELVGLPHVQRPSGEPAAMQPHQAGQAAGRGFREIAAADRRFEITSFLEGAGGAYRMVLEAYWRGDKDELAQLCDRDVLDGFSTAIDARAAAGEVLDNRLVRINETVITGASLDAPLARITVRFAADLATVTRDKAGNVIAGSLVDAVKSRDVWTFVRNVNSPDPDWLLDETDEG